MNVDRECPVCNDLGTEVGTPEGFTLVCKNTDCRIYTFAPYYG